MAGWRTACLVLVISFAAGIVFASLADFIFDWLVLFLILTLVFAGLFFIRRRNKFFIWWALVFLGLVLGLTRWQFVDFNKLDGRIDCRVSCRGLIVSDPDRREKTTRLVLKTEGTDQKILAITDNFTDYAYGDEIEFSGKLQTPQNFLIPQREGQADQNKVFDYKNYLLARGIDQTTYYPKIKIIDRNQGSRTIAFLYGLKNNFLSNLRRVIPEPEATLGGGLILGDKGGLGQETEAEFRRAGLSHIIVLSGYNITIVAESILKFFAWLPASFSWLLGVFAIFFFVVMTGGEAAAVRAAIMGAIALVARHYGRTYEAGAALVLAGFLMVLWNPRLLVFDLGFQLSFLATLGLIYLSPLTSKLFRFLPERWNLRELVATTSGAQIAVYPWLLYKAGNASLVGFISNIFVLPVIPAAMFLSFLTGSIGFISYQFSLLAGYPAYFILAYIVKAAHFFGTLF